MTAEISILNKSAVALAADSAVTLSLGKEHKVFNTVNKVFRLSLYHPIGVMIYGGASIMNVPWETIIKLYRTKLHDKSFKTLQEYVDDFMKFLVSEKNNFFPPEYQSKYIEYTAAGICNEILDIINDSVKEEINKGSLNEQQIKKLASQVIIKYHDNMKKLPDSTSGISKIEIKRIYSKLIGEVIVNVFQKLEIYKKDLNIIVDLISEYFTKDHYSNSHSGVVFAGFGDDEIFPRMVSYKIEAVVNNKARFSLDRETIISQENGGEINRFAQGDMVTTIIEGIDPQQRTTIDSYVTEILKSYPGTILSILEKELKLDDVQKKNIISKTTDFSVNLYKDFIDNIHRYRGEKHVIPVIRMVSLLPKDELAVMAETLVNMTAFKQRVSMSAETVGGPIDVAIITKGDGFIWVKRKPSFDRQINLHL